jgi:hypothetical protein
MSQRLSGYHDRKYTSHIIYYTDAKKSEYSHLQMLDKNASNLGDSL